MILCHLVSDDRFDFLLEDVTLKVGIVVHLGLDPIRLHSVKDEVKRAFGGIQSKPNIANPVLIKIRL